MDKQKKDKGPDDYKLITTAEAAKAWGVSPKSIYRLVRLGKLRPKVGLKSWRFKIGDFDKVLDDL